MKREQFFECVFVADRSEYRFHLRAWTAAEAARHLVSDLGENGLDLPGDVRVLDPRGKVLVTVEYVPPRHAERGPDDCNGRASDPVTSQEGPDSGAGISSG
jgi:hypothetical protein